MISTPRLHANANLLFPLTLGLLLIAILLIAGAGIHNVYYTWTDNPNGMYPCNDNGNNFWLSMFVEWVQGGERPHMALGQVCTQAVISAEKLDELIARRLAEKGIAPESATGDQVNETMHVILKELAAKAIK